MNDDKVSPDPKESQRQKDRRAFHLLVDAAIAKDLANFPHASAFERDYKTTIDALTRRAWLAEEQARINAQTIRDMQADHRRQIDILHEKQRADWRAEREGHEALLYQTLTATQASHQRESIVPRLEIDGEWRDLDWILRAPFGHSPSDLANRRWARALAQVLHDEQVPAPRCSCGALEGECVPCPSCAECLDVTATDCANDWCRANAAAEAGSSAPPNIEALVRVQFRKKPVVIEAVWIITGVNGERYPCKPDIFDKTYEPVVDR